MHAVMGAGRLIAGRYRLQGPIGRGAMGIVWRGRDELLARDVAVKEVQITALASPSDAEAIYQCTLREARTAARLKHPSVVTVYDVIEEAGSPWIIMELVEARSLDRIITEEGPLPPLQAAELGSSLVSALAIAHAAGVLHRDVKPSNVLVADDGKAVLTDFGIATFAEDPSAAKAGLVLGTPGFTAPERVRGDIATAASDLWSVGATLYAAVEGRGPFDRAGGSAGITARVATEDAPRAPSAGPLEPVIDALLGRDPGSRPDATTAARLLSDAAITARTGARALGDGWLAGHEAAAAATAGAEGTAGAGQPSGGNGSLRSRTRSGLSMPCSRRWRLMVVGACIAAIVVAALVGWDTYSRTQTTQALNTSPPGTLGDGGSAGGTSAASGSANSGGRHGSAPVAGNPAEPSAGPSREASSSSSASASPGSQEPAPSSVTPTPSTTPAGPVLPPGYVWHYFSAAQLSSAAGFKIGLPRAWTQHLTGQIVQFNQPVQNFYLTVNVGVWTYPKPLAEAEYLQQKDAANYAGYSELALGAVGFKAIGGFKAAPAAELKFSWDKPSAGKYTEMVMLVSLATKAGVQTYRFSFWAPSATFGVARGVFHTALATFRPLPPA